MPYLRELDTFLRTALTDAADAMRDSQMRFLRTKQLGDGGFCGRRGASDPYYTDFALRVVGLLDHHCDAVGNAAEYIACAPAPGDIVEAFCMLNCRRMLDEYGCAADIDCDRLMQAVESRRRPSGGWAGAAGDSVSAYGTFLAALCHQIADTPLPAPAAAAEAISALQTADGGFREQPSDRQGQTNATAAAIAFLRMTGRVTSRQQLGAREFLLRMQAPDGGLRAHAAAPHADLLSTFTGMLTLLALGSIGGLDVQAAVRFLRWVTVPDGGFVAYIGDTEPDVEYTYYGLGCLALLSAYAGTKQQ